MTVAKPKTATLTVRQRVLDWLDEQYEPVTANEIAAGIGHDDSRLVMYHLNFCRRTGDVEDVGMRRIGQARSRLWVRSEPPDTFVPVAVLPPARLITTWMAKILEWLDDQYETSTTAEIAEAIGAGHAASVARILRFAEARGEVLCVGTRPSGKGRPATLWVRA